MKAGFVATEIGHQEGGGFMGGTVNNIVDVSRQLAERGHDVVIITTTPRDAAEDPFDPITWADVYSIDPRWSHASPGYLASFTKFAVSTIRRLHGEDRLDVVSTHAGFSVWGGIGSISSVFGCPSVHVQYCPIATPSGRALYDVVQSRILSKAFLSGIDRTVAVSDNVADSLVSNGVGGLVDIVHTGVDTDRYAPDAADRWNGFGSDGLVIGYMGSLRDQKGLDVLVDAFESLDDDSVQLALGLEVRSERSDGELWSRIQNDPTIHTYGIIEDVPAFLSACDVFAVPFRNTVGPADYPLAALEAMSCGVATVATRAGGLADLLADGESGLLIDEAEPDGLREALYTLLDDELYRSELGAGGRSTIVSEFSLESICDQYETIFSEVIGTDGN